MIRLHATIGKYAFSRQAYWPICSILFPDLTLKEQNQNKKCQAGIRSVCMKKQKIISFILAIMLFLFVLPIHTVEAANHTLKSLSIHVQLNEDGSARIKERRVANLTKGTESFIVI